MKKGFKIVSLALVLIICISLIYFAAVVIKAWVDMPGIMAKALISKNQTLNINDLSQWQLRALLAVEDPIFTSIRELTLKLLGPELPLLPKVWSRYITLVILNQAWLNLNKP